MKILHTADWHLGKKLDRFSRLEEQTAVMDELLNLAEQQQVDLVLVAGDLFDSFYPSTAAIDLFYKSLKRLAKEGSRAVVAIAGNHDSPSLINAPNPLARECGIILIGQPNAEVPPFELRDFRITKSESGFIEIQFKKYDYPVRILHTPYANEIRLRQNLEEEKENKLNQILADNWRSLADKFCDDKGVNLLITHLYMNPKEGEILEEPDGEKPIKIGNADMIFSDAIPPQVQYTALGHLHGYKNIGTETHPIVYSSSPIAYSFSEAGQAKYAVIITAEPAKPVTFEKHPLSSGKPLHRKSFKGVDAALEWLREHPHTLVELTLETEDFLKAEERKMLYQTHQGIVYLIPKLSQKQAESPKEEKEINLNQSINSIFEDYFRYKMEGQNPNQELKDLFNEILTAE